MTAPHQISFIPNPVQRRFITSQAKADLYSSRMGEGKSTALAWSAFTHTRHNPGARHLLIRDTWENMQGTTFKTFLEWFPDGVCGDWKASTKTFTWKPGLATGEVLFTGMERPEDASKLMSRELAGLGIDEPAPAIGSVGIDEMIFDIGMTRLRQPNMKWYQAKLAENNPDESHWTYRRFVEDPPEGFMLWQPDVPENLQNLPENYYEDLRRILGHRPDLIRRFVDGNFGFQQIGKAVTPQWNDKLHLTIGLVPLRGQPLYCLWDFGLNPTIIITQVSPMGYWNVLDAFVGEDIGVAELIGDVAKPLIHSRYKKMELIHIGDPAGETREQSSSKTTAVRVIKRELGGKWKPGPRFKKQRLEPLQAVLSRTISGTGVVQVDRKRAAPVWHALRGGWHFHVARTGVISGEPVKDKHSHPGDAMGYGAAVLFPDGALRKRVGAKAPTSATYFKPPKRTIKDLIKAPEAGIVPIKHGAPL